MKHILVILSFALQACSVVSLVACTTNNTYVEAPGVDDSATGDAREGAVAPDGGGAGQDASTEDASTIDVHHAAGDAGGIDAASGGPDAASDAASGAEGSVAEVCPTSPPVVGAACPAGLLGVECEYGSNPNLWCETVISCTSSGWQGGWTPVGFPKDCAAPTPCPATYADVPNVPDCTLGLDCAYAQGQCNCQDYSPAGISIRWTCTTPAAGCPEPRPNLGTACSQAGLLCDYGSCTGGSEQRCNGVLWGYTFTPTCP